MDKTSTNDITGNKIKTKLSNEKYIQNYDRIFRKNKELKNDETINSTIDTTSNQ